jgi:hypothetical protein
VLIQERVTSPGLTPALKTLSKSESFRVGCAIQEVQPKIIERARALVGTNVQVDHSYENFRLDMAGVGTSGERITLVWFDPVVGVTTARYAELKAWISRGGR